jgi:hypothetical protein
MFVAGFNVIISEPNGSLTRSSPHISTMFKTSASPFSGPNPEIFTLNLSSPSFSDLPQINIIAV